MKEELTHIALTAAHIALGFVVTLAVLPVYVVLKTIDKRFDITCP